MTVNCVPPLMFAKLAITCILQLETHVFFVQLKTALSVMLPAPVHSALMAFPILMGFAILHALQIVTQPLDAKLT
jgi:hypothetical protein